MTGPRFTLRTGRVPLARVPMSAAARMADQLARQAHDDGHARIRARLAGDAGNGSILLLAAAVPLIVLLVMAAANLAGAIAGVGDALGGAQ